MNFLDFILNTYEGTPSIASRAPEDTADDRESAVGRPPNPRIEYLASANKGEKYRILRTPGHETLPRISGSWFPRHNGGTDNNLHNACMLALLRPWRMLQELKEENETFNSAYNNMVASLSREHRNFITNAQYYYECVDDAKNDTQSTPREGAATDFATSYGNYETEWDLSDSEKEHVDYEEEMEELIKIAKLRRRQARERLFGDAAVDEGFRCGFFLDATEYEPIDQAHRATGREEAEKIRRWEKELKSATRLTAEEIGTIQHDQQPTTYYATENTTTSTQYMPPLTAPLYRQEITNTVSMRPKLAMLNKEQRRAHDIIEERLRQHMEGH